MTLSISILLTVSRHKMVMGFNLDKSESQKALVSLFVRAVTVHSAVGWVQWGCGAGGLAGCCLRERLQCTLDTITLCPRSVLQQQGLLPWLLLLLRLTAITSWTNIKLQEWTLNLWIWIFDGKCDLFVTVLTGQLMVGNKMVIINIVSVNVK